ncbi:hypothetical protein C8F01DRAFT_659688 [Mycena amicta]|nr:hypothetical protein C8F01DRAFT_659688 [Mycena amicta]
MIPPSPLPRFVQPSPANPTYGFPTAQQWAEPFYSGAPLGRRNSAVDTASDIGPTRPRSNSNHKHAVSSPYSKSKVQRGGSSSKPSASASAAFSNLPPQYLRLPQGVEPAKNELLISPIVFKYVESRAAGVRLFDIEHNSDLLEGVNDMVFAQSGLSWREIRLSFVWPGYKSSDNLKRFKLKDGTRGRLLFTAGAALKKLMAEARYVEGAEAAWSIRRPNGTLRFSEKDVLILGLQHMGGASFLIELAVKLRALGTFKH